MSLGIVPHTCIGHRYPEMMHNLVAYQWLATYTVQLLLPYLEHIVGYNIYRGFSKLSSLGSHGLRPIPNTVSFLTHI